MRETGQLIGHLSLKSIFSIGATLFVCASLTACKFSGMNRDLTSPVGGVSVSSRAELTSVIPGNGRVALTWTLVDGAIEYDVYRSISPSSGFTKVGTSPTSSYTDPTAAVGTTYYYEVIARLGNGATTDPGSTSAPAVSFGVPAKLGFIVQPSRTASGSPISPAVKIAVQDSFGTTVTTASDTITLAFGSNSGGGTLTGTLSLATTAGVATFAGLSIDAAAAGYSLTATSTHAYTSATSGFFNITSGVPSKLLLTGPTPFNTGVCNAFTVTVKDANGNSSSYSGTHQIAFSGQGSGIFYSDACVSTLPLNGGGKPYLTIANTSSGTVYFKDASAESLTLSVTDGVLTQGSLSVVVTSPVPTTPITDTLLLNLDAAQGTGSSFAGTGCAVTTWTDLSASHLDGTLNNFNTCGATEGWNGSGVAADPYRLDFPGVNSFKFVEAADIVPSSNLATFETWVKVNSYSATDVVALQSNWLGNGQTFLLALDSSGNPEFCWNNLPGNSAFGLSTNYNCASTATSIGTASWSDVVAVRNGTSLKVYINGSQIYSASPMDAASFADSGSSLRIGGHFRNSYNSGLDGSIAVSRIYDRALSDAEVAQNCYSLKDRFTGVTCHVQTSLQISPSSPTLATGANQTFTAVGGVTPYTYNIVSGGGSINASTGDYTAPGTAGSATVRVTDSIGGTSDAAVTIN